MNRITTFLLTLVTILLVISCSQPITEVGSHLNEEEKRRIEAEVIVDNFPPTKGGIVWTGDLLPIIPSDQKRQYIRPTKRLTYKTFEVYRHLYSNASQYWPNNNIIQDGSSYYRILSWRWQPNWRIRWVRDGTGWDYSGHWEMYNYAFAVNDNDWTPVYNYYHDMGNIAPTVIKVGSEYFMYFTKYTRLYSSENEYRAYTNQYSTSYRYSDNAVSWNERTLELFKEVDLNNNTLAYLDNVRKGQVIYSVMEQGNKLHFWYAGTNSNKSNQEWRYFYAQSKNLEEKEVITVTSQTTANLLDVLDTSMKGFDSELMEKCTVLNSNSKYHMWYTGYDGFSYRIGYASSPNGINNWARRGAPILAGTPGKFDADGVADPYVIFEDGIYKMWYAGYNKITDRWQIGLQYSHDGINFAYYDQANYSPIEILGPTSGDYDIRYPTVIRDGNKYKIWFSFRDAGVSAGSLKLPAPWEIGYAESTVIQ